MAQLPDFAKHDFWFSALVKIPIPCKNTWVSSTTFIIFLGGGGGGGGEKGGWGGGGWMLLWEEKM